MMLLFLLSGLSVFWLLTMAFPLLFDMIADKRMVISWKIESEENCRGQVKETLGEERTLIKVSERDGW